MPLLFHLEGKLSFTAVTVGADAYIGPSENPASMDGFFVY
jgi:hypothetical protein